ncbi:MAG: hypothetical protein KGH78_05085 [Candidatus Micrarchaeota archaeon]|nr:hypothetical protein [Candidatus Micrarchaeota archaeon]
MPESVRQRNKRTIVIGAGIAGLLSARVSSVFSDEVLVIDADSLRNDPAARALTPQGKHPHLLLARGEEIVELLLAGFGRKLDEDGVPKVQLGKSVGWFNPKGLVRDFAPTIDMHSATRGFFEWKIRTMLDGDSIKFVDKKKVAELVIEKNTVMGVRAGGEDFQADLVVDASGRNAITPMLFDRAGIPRAKETVIDSDVGYASRRFKRIEDINGRWNAIYIQPTAQNGMTGGAILPIENGESIVGLTGIGGVHPPSDPSGWMEFAARMREPAIYDAIKDAEPVSEISVYNGMMNRLRHYEKARMPGNFVVIGDAVCAFDPLYGQGMTAAALGALELAQWLREGNLQDTVSFQKRLRKVSEPLWLMAAIEDTRLAGVGGKTASMRMYQFILDKVFDSATRNERMARNFAEVVNVLMPKEVVLGPEHTLTLLRSILRNR